MGLIYLSHIHIAIALLQRCFINILSLYPHAISMVNVVLEVMAIPLLNASTMQIVGPSGCGKTFFTARLISLSDKMYENPIRKIYWLMGSEDGEHGATSDIMAKMKRKIHYMNGFQKGWQKKLITGDAIVIDDLFIECTKEDNFNNLFTKIARHRGVTVIFLTQNLFHQGGQHRTRNLNVHYLVIFKNPRGSTIIDYVARQAFSSQRKFLIEAFNDATENKPHSYLFLDFTQSCPDDLRVRTDIFNPNGCIIYKHQ